MNQEIRLEAYAVKERMENLTKEEHFRCAANGCRECKWKYDSKKCVCCNKR